MTKLVYLDSSDFSNLSVPSDKLTPENRQILALLRQHKTAGTAKFFMSAIHFSEAVHSATEHKESAVQRAFLMRELCGTNLLRFSTEIPRLELEKALNRESAKLSVQEITSQHGEWFGVDMNLDHLAESRSRLNNQIKEHLSKVNRRERRKFESELSRTKKSSRAKWRSVIQGGRWTVVFRTL